MRARQSCIHLSKKLQRDLDFGGRHPGSGIPHDEPNPAIVRALG
jgi:hypothetical protein